MKNFTAGNYIQHGSYEAFLPKPINRSWVIDNMAVLPLLSQADRQLGRLDMYSEYVNIDLYINMHIAKEAIQSSRIEGTQTRIEEAFMQREHFTHENRNDWEEVQNYIDAMNASIDSLEHLPFSSRLICNAHSILMKGVRGQHKLPGEFRRSQNWIGGATINDAIFIPPPDSYLGELMSDLEKFAHNQLNPIPDLIKIALIHYQFETIHPFLDGNGRVGRLMIPLYLVGKKILKKPVLYLSDYFERHRQLYYENLMRVRSHNDINQWLKFFLSGVIETAKQGIGTFDGILQMRESLEKRLKFLGNRAADAQKVIHQLFKRPVINAFQVAQTIEKSQVTAYKLIADLEKVQILTEITGHERNRTYIFREYLDLF